jgi:uncharacterized protein (TIGR00255 family)
MKSMTGYGEAQAEGRWAKVVVQARSLNHRHLDLQVRLPKEYMAVEEEIRRVVRQTISRGRIDLIVTRSPVKAFARRVELDEDLLGQYLRTFRRAQSQFGLGGRVEISLLARLPELFRIVEPPAKALQEKGLILKVLRAALKGLDRSRTSEGNSLKRDMEAQFGGLSRIAALIGKEAAEARSRGGESAPIKGAINAAESAAGVLKGDVHEEVIRLKSHVAELGRLLRLAGPVGKQIEFVLQEIQRELNTIGSKAPQLRVVQAVLAGKERVERVREQVQNVE